MVIMELNMGFELTPKAPREDIGVAALTDWLCESGSNQIFITKEIPIMITFKVIATQVEVVEMKTRSHHKIYSVHECKKSSRIGYVSESVQSFDKDGNCFKTSNEIKSFYFGFPNSSQAERFEDYCKYQFPLLASHTGHCESRLAKRLKSPFEVKIRNLNAIADVLFIFFSKCIDKELAPKVIDMPVAEVKKKLARLR